MVKQEIIIVDEKNLEKVKKKISKDGSDSFHVLADFDRTLTYGLDADGKIRTATVISQLRADPKYLGEDYKKVAEEMFEEYHPLEVDSDHPMDAKKEKMRERWQKHFDWIAKNGLTKKIIQQVVHERSLRFRKGALEFMKELNDRNIPLVIMSAAPGDMLIAYLEYQGLMFPNVYVVANRYEFDSMGRALRIKEPIIHTFNKTEITLNNHPIYEKIKDRKNVLLLGDSLGDEGMIEGFRYKNLIKIGFLNEEVEKNLEAFRNAYDVVLTGDQDFTYVNRIMGEML
ncbi:hypothetical protein COU57_01670 [Candidatus Pacearchaeota archaeon CG10_big_fil_rev_8_21_14_0_10_32_14]|nr:MAG: hypothetical protein COU57_01670 [Candidatus Pacearchaeota archaeon CG10_big_fil_rev_8_21_14_0_10_32_14]